MSATAPSSAAGAQIPEPAPDLASGAAAAAASPQPSGDAAPQATDPALLDVLERNNRLLDAIITRPAQPATRPQEPEPEPAASPPDPVIDPQGHARWVSDRIARAERNAERRIAESRAEIESRQAMAELWQDFQREHPDEARLPELVLRALELETNGTLRVAGDPAALRQRVASRVRDRLAIARGDAMRREPAPGGTAAPAPAQANRTAGIPGGSVPPAAPAAAKPEQPVKSFADQIRDQQMKSPYF